MRKLVLLLWALPLASCATVLAPKIKQEEIAVRSTPPGADAAILCEGKPAGSGVTPTTITIHRNAGDCILEITKEGFQKQTVNIEGGVNPVYWSNLFFSPLVPAGAYLVALGDSGEKAIGVGCLAAGAVAFGTDFWTGAVHAHRNNNIAVTLKPK